MRRTQTPKIFRAGILAAAIALTGCVATDSTDASGGGGDAAAAATEAPDDIVAADIEETAAVDVEVVTTDNQESHFDSDDLEYDESEVVSVSLDGTSATADSPAVSVDQSTVTITAEGVYSFSGALDDGGIIVDAADEDDVTLILDGVDITNADGAAIAVMNADDAVVIMADGSTNTLTDGADYTFADVETDEPNATLFSTADLTIAGDGALVVNGNYNDGIASKDGLAIEAGTITVSAADDGIRGKDYVVIDGGTVTVDAGGDGIKADNDEDVDRGYVQINGGDVVLAAGDDGVQAATDVIVIDGQVTIDAGSVSGTGRALQGDVLVLVSGGVIDGTAVDDAIHSNDTVTIDGGTLTLAAGDDGIHGDLFVTVNAGSITITESFEGIEAEVITINDGAIDITSSDDGLNVASSEAAATAADPGVAAEPGVPVEPGTEVAQPVGRGGGGRGAGGAGGAGGAPVEAVGDYYIYINGGTTVITITGDLDEQGDGIDANGHVEMTGGLVVVSGPTDTRNSAVDYSGGSFVMSGGTFIGTNVDGRNSEGIGVGSSQASMYVTTGSVMSAGTVVHIEDADGENVVTFDPANDYSVIVFSSPDLVEGESYDVYLGGTVTGDSATDLYEAADYTAGELAGTVTATL